MNPSTPLLPVVKPLILCEDVAPGTGGGRIHLVNAFDAIRSRNSPPFPYRKDEFCVYVQLSDASGELPAWVEVVDADTMDPIFQTAQHLVAFPHRRRVQRALFRIRQCLFPRAGEYLVQFF